MKVINWHICTLLDNAKLDVEKDRDLYTGRAIEKCISDHRQIYR